MSLLTNTRHEEVLVNPKTLILFGQQKIGKTEALTKLEGNLILDFDPEGTDYYQCNRVKINNFETFKELLKELVSGEFHSKFITIDTLTTFYEEYINALAVMDFNKDTGSNKPISFDINKLDYGKGHYYKREALKKYIKFFSRYCDTLIITGHVADRAINNNDEAIGIKELDIEGKLKSILAVRVSAMGYMYRSGENENSISFKASDSAITGSRSKHLTGKDIVISKKIFNEDGSDYTLETYWDRIFV